MENLKYSKYVITQPHFLKDFGVEYHDYTHPSGMTYPIEAYLDRHLLKEANHWLNIEWHWETSAITQAHVHEFDEIVFFIGSDPKNLRDLGGEVEFWLGEGKDAEKYLLTSTTVVWLPKGLTHGPLRFNRVDRPILNMALVIGTGDYV